MGVYTFINTFQLGRKRVRVRECLCVWKYITKTPVAAKLYIMFDVVNVRVWVYIYRILNEHEYTWHIGDRLNESAPCASSLIHQI